MASSARSSKKKELPRVLVAGGASFLGASLCDALLLQNLDVICLDSLNTGKAENLLGLFVRPNFKFIKQDIQSAVLPKVDYIFHLAGLEEYLNGVDVSLTTLETNSLGTRKLLKVAQSSKAKFLLASSIDLYQGFLSKLSLEHYFGPKKEDERRFSHHEAKRFAEALVFEFFKKFHVDARIVRLANVYGPKMNLGTGTVLGEMITNAVSNKPLIIKGEGLTVLHPTFVDDVVYGLIKAMFGKGTTGKIYNLVNPQEVTVLQLAYALQDVKPNLRLSFSKEKEELKFPLSKAELLVTQEELRWQPRVSLKEGLRTTLEWFAKAEERKGQTKQVLKKREEQLKEAEKALQKEIEGLAEKVKEPKKAGEVKETKVREKKEKKTEKKQEEPLVKIKTSEEFKEVSKEPLVISESFLFEGLKKISAGIKGLFKKPKVNLPQVSLSFPRLSFPALSRKRIGFLFSLLVVFVGVLYPIGSFAFFSFYGWQNLKDFSEAVEKQDFVKAQKNSFSAEKSFKKAQDGLSAISWLASMLKKREEQAKYQLLLTAAADASSALKHASNAFIPILEMVRVIISSGPGNLETLLSEAKLEIDLAEDKLALAEGSFKNIDASDFLSSLNAPISLAKEKIPYVREQLTAFRQILAFLPEIIGLHENKTYLLLFQNNMELRPGGGFIGSYGLVYFAGGRLTKIEIEDVYTADGQLKEAVLPPKPIKDYLNQGNWFLRDSNWSAHFPSNAAQAEWFLDKSLGIKVDGVVALDVSVLQKLLAAIGPVELVDFRETVDEKNVFEKTEYHSEADFFPGSTAKKDFLGSLARTLLEKVLTSEKEKWPRIVSAFSSSLAQKHLMVFLHNPEVNKILAQQKWDGTVLLEQKPLVNELSDYLMVVDANLGANKANFFLRREVSSLTVIDRDGGVAKRLTLVYHNQSPAETWPGGTYKNYLRVYVPSGSVLQKVEVGDLTDPGLVEKGRELGKTVFAIYFEVPIQSKKRIILDFQLPSVMKFSNGVGIYSLLVQKQPGVIDDHLTVTVNYPSFYKIIKSEPTGKGSEQAIRYSTTLEEDRKFKIEFIK